MLFAREIYRPNIEIRRPPGVRCPNCGNVPRTRGVFFILPTLFKFHCHVCNAYLISNAALRILDLAAYGIAALLFIELLPLTRFTEPFLDIWSKPLLAAVCFVIIKLPVTCIQMKVGKYRQIYL